MSDTVIAVIFFVYNSCLFRLPLRHTKDYKIKSQAIQTVHLLGFNLESYSKIVVIN